MATKPDNLGLLSKMAKFVRNPTKDWAELDRPAVEQDSSFDKAALKAMIERKRQNDFIRKREFDQLRKLRSRGATATVGLGRPSVFQSSLATDPDGRAVTLKKIDEIEAQMSKQWWKGKQEGAAPAPAAAAPVAAQAQERAGMDTAPDQVLAPVARANPPAATPTPAPVNEAQQFGATVSSEVNLDSLISSGEFIPTQMGDGMGPGEAPAVPVGAAAAPAAARPPNTATQNAALVGALARGYDGSEAGFSTSKLFAIDVEDMATDPELEEAAIRFANGDDEGARSGLLEALRAQSEPSASTHSWLAALLDLYRATHDQAGFDQAVVEFARHFDAVVPHWEAIGESAAAPVAQDAAVVAGDAGAEEVAEEPQGPNYAEGAIWVCPARLDDLALESLRDAMATNPTPWHLDWSRLKHIDASAMSLMGGLFSSLCTEPVELRFSGALRLVDTLRTLMPAGDASISQEWWTTRLNALRTLQLLDDFELAALDFCVTYEVSPPPWQEARCQYANVEDDECYKTEAAAWDSGGNASAQQATALMSVEAAVAQQLELKGSIMGDASDALGAEAQDDLPASNDILVSCRHLVRVDFSAAGSILNWVAMREAEGCRVQFREVHRLVAAFFNVIGINEHARVVPRRM